jgi:hypothetical protein
MINPTFIETYDNVISKKVCDYLISKFDSFVNNFEKDRNFDKLIVDDTQAWLDDKHDYKLREQIWKTCIVPYCRKYSITGPDYNSIGIHVELKIQKTEPGQGFHAWHCEIDKEAENQKRLLAFTLYLNDMSEGGETEYLFQNTRLSPKAGLGAVWPAGFTHLHRGNPPLKETKYIVTGWVQY